ncbi:ATP-binding protein [Actinoplanes sp. M2I2]|uniref:ATP-binding protein n=1 Tax=Actinoplanes sp. M2I2 TaxID=1734444 RepID=UPI00201FC439|nr:ATP-binding protein [Actinoplanes sp. M2I2]
MSEYADVSSACLSVAARLAAALTGVALDPADDPSVALLDLRRGTPALPVHDRAARRRWVRLQERYRLSDFEMDLFALAALPSAHEVFGPLFARLHPRRLPVLSAGLAARSLLDGAAGRVHLDEALLDGPLMSGGVLQADEAPYAQRGFTLPAGLWETLRGFGGDSPAAAAPPAPAVLRTPELELAKALLDRDDVTILLTSDDPVEVEADADALIRSSGRTPYPVREASPVSALLCTVRGEVPRVTVPAGAVDLGWLAGLRGPAVIVAPATAAVDAGARILFTVPLSAPALAERHATWQALLPGQEAAAWELAVQHRVGPVLAGRAHADAAAAAAVAGRSPDRAGIAHSLRRRAVVALPAAARLVHPSAGWADVVLPRPQRELLSAAVGRAHGQARVLNEWGLAGGRSGVCGVRLLFAGAPGTGKTLAAELIAAELGLELLVVDLSALVSRWLGETEKHIAAVFDAAERAQAVLFFDEADALFARRTSVGDAHDRWANLETAYLLDRLERLEGVAILATNLRANIDDAVVRRLEFVVEFNEPESPERERIWRAHLPATLPLAPDVELGELARLYPITGAVIRNAAVAAAFLAAADGGRVTQGHLVLAVRREYDKAGRSFPGPPRRRPAGQQSGVNGARP